MQNDEVIWQIIRHKHCSFMAKIETGIFCRNPYSVTGICNRSSCPLANSRYATIRDHDGVFYLYMKTIERSHQPTKLWERVKLPLNYEKALEIIDKNLMYWPKLLVHKVKQRLTKMYQMRIRMRKLALKTREKIMTTPRKDIKREARRAAKAEIAAAIETAIEKELVERLSGGVYKENDSDIYNLEQKSFDKALTGVAHPEAEIEDEEAIEKELVERLSGGVYKENDSDIYNLEQKSFDKALTGVAHPEAEIEDEEDIKREARRAAKAEIAAAIETAIEKELVERLSGGVYKENDSDIYNLEQKSFDKALTGVAHPEAEIEDEEEYEKEYVEGYDEDLEDEDDIEDFGGFAINDDDDDGSDEEEDEGTVAIDNKRAREKSGYGLRKTDKDNISTKLKKKQRVLVEVEHDDTDERQKAIH